MAFRILQSHNRQVTSKPTKQNTAKLSTISHRESFEQEMDSGLVQREEKENSTPDEEWAALQQVVYTTAKTYLGKPDRKHQDWFDPNDQELQNLMSRRDQAHQTVLQTRRQSDKQGNTRTDNAAIYGRSSDQKESPMDWSPHEDVTRHATKGGSLLSTVFWSPVQGYHHEKPEAERYKDRLMDTILTAER